MIDMKIVTKKIHILQAFLLLISSTQLMAVDFITITTPANASTITSAPISITGTSSQASTQVQLIVNTTTIGSATTDGSGNWNFSLPSLINANYTLTANLISSSQGTLATTTNAFTANVPTVTVSSPAQNETIFLNPATIAGKISASSGLVNISLDGTLVTTATADTSGNWSTTYTLTSNGAHTLLAQLMIAGSPAASTSISITAQVPVINSTEFITSLGVGTNGQILLAATSANPAFAHLTSTGGTVAFVLGPNSLNLETTVTTASPMVADTDSGVAAPALGVLNIYGGSNISTTGAGNTVTVKVNGTADHAVQIGNATGALSSIPVGTNGQVLLAATAANPAFASLISTGSSVAFVTGANSLDLRSTPVFGNVLRVDQVFGNNTTAFRNGPPYSTINAALAAAQSGDAVWIFPGTYAESFTIPTGVTVRGLAKTAVNILKGVTVATDLVTMGASSALTDVTLTLTSISHVQLRGIVFPGTTSTTAQVERVNVTVDNSTAGAGSSSVYGIHSNGTGTPTFNTTALRASSITVNSVNSGAKRGILVDTANSFNIRDTTIAVTGGTSTIGAETSNASAALSARACTISGSMADISQTLGTITLSSTDLVHATSNSLTFTTDVQPATITWAASGNAPGAGTRFMCVGTDVAAANAMAVRMTQPCIVTNLSVASRVASTVSSSTWTVFKNGSSTPLAVTLDVGPTSAVDSIHSVSFATGDLLSMQYIRGAGAGTQLADIVVTINVY